MNCNGKKQNEKGKRLLKQIKQKTKKKNQIKEPPSTPYKKFWHCSSWCMVSNSTRLRCRFQACSIPWPPTGTALGVPNNAVLASTHGLPFPAYNQDPVLQETESYGDSQDKAGNPKVILSGWWQTSAGQTNLLKTATTERQMAWEESWCVVIAFSITKATCHPSVHQAALAQCSFLGCPLDPLSSHLLPLHFHKLWKWRRNTQHLQGSFHMLLPLLQMPRPMLQAHSETVASCRSSKYHPHPHTPIALLRPGVSYLCSVTWIKLLHQPAGVGC